VRSVRAGAIDRMPSSLHIGVDALLRFRGVESSRVEFKSGWNEGPTSLQVIQTICAFANDFQNLNGGYVVLGVEARDGRAILPPAGIEPEAIERIQKSIRGQCRRIQPEYPPVLSPESVEGRLILVIWAPGSPSRPHQAPRQIDGGSHADFVRIGSETVEA
jgi:ATP-dependent DNA helicase RecG